ncbi:hypothetical protein WMF04_23825 [Sorangium sp. So ce260]|uniref:hypothetical protein n=1 Tax=Sorangium sp. So ce260 TaxID=3133291 RepID=UPI003F62938B
MNRIITSLVLVLASAAAACVGEVDEAVENGSSEASEEGDSLDTLGDEEAVGAAEQALIGWGDTDRGRPPVSCDNGAAVSAFSCGGRNCGVLAGHCQPTGARSGSTHWTTFFSEEGTNYRQCDFGQVVTGFACRGKYCDDVALQCSFMEGRTHTHCTWWTPLIHSGSGEIVFPEGYYAAGARCFGSFCGAMDFYICRL